MCLNLRPPSSYSLSLLTPLISMPPPTCFTSANTSRGPQGKRSRLSSVGQPCSRGTRGSLSKERKSCRHSRMLLLETCPFLLPRAGTSFPPSGCRPLASENLAATRNLAFVASPGRSPLISGDQKFFGVFAEIGFIILQSPVRVCPGVS